MVPDATVPSMALANHNRCEPLDRMRQDFARYGASREDTPFLKYFISNAFGSPLQRDSIVTQARFELTVQPSTHLWHATTTFGTNLRACHPRASKDGSTLSDRIKQVLPGASYSTHIVVSGPNVDESLVCGRCQGCYHTCWQQDINSLGSTQQVTS